MDKKHYEMPKWSVFIKEEFDEGNCAYFELKWATVNLYEFESCLEEDYCSLEKADAKTNEKLQPYILNLKETTPTFNLI